ncbi:alpha-L-rhamnosidase [Paenibacillus sedimenti]|uniref:alpha-L-rhamnosidase n=1 Tax=Paenibacillus sedimenti TaxID=2770274 RepID=A0A926KTG7_9BACL|nr:alpha-L-rhamnosidase [Paenibacillus sedimenti]MBD0383824.1 family 78 glycoside hydrolase catalytic domain [Paenibacillus sedimenti]
MGNLGIEKLKCEYRTNPLGIGVSRPRISWQLQSDRRGTVQRGYRIVVADEKGNFDKLIWDSGYKESDQSIQVPYAGPELKSRTRYSYRVKVWDGFGRESEWSETAWWEIGLLSQSEWTSGQWITPNQDEIDPQSEPAFLLRKRFDVQDKIVSARIYATAAGVYELYMNGARVGEDLLAPGWTSYQSRLQVQTYDVTELLQEGGNGIGIMLADGWYKSGIGFENRNFKYGDRRAALLQLHIRYQSGAEEAIGTDSSWKASTGAVRYATLYHGETYDARLEQEGWSRAQFDDSEWQSVRLCPDLPPDILVAQENSPTRVTQTIRPVSCFVTPAGDHVLDMGQNMVGRIRFTVEAPAGTRIELKHAEVLDKDGNIYFGNLRPAKQRVEYIAKGNGSESYAPHFTFMGFRYVKVEGFPGQENGLPLEAFVGEVMHTDMEPTGEFECSDARVNQLQSNIQWGQRGNFLDVPTDCPQRDERLGWTGDAQVFISTALFNFQGGPFFTKWLHDLKAEQHADGGVPFVIPDIVGGANSAAWGDAAVICPWTVYQYYGDQRLLAEQFESMKRWVEFIRSQGENEYLWNTGFHFGDWLGLDAKENSYIGATPTALVATAYYAYSTRIVRDAARALGYEEEARTYGELHRNVVQAFQDEFMTKNGRIASPTQTAHVLALVFDLVDDSVRDRVARELNDLIVENDYHLTTGFVGTPYLCFALSNNGYHDTAIKLLLQESYPGWLYSVSKGATTIWEHWDSIKPDGSFWSDDMNSFNHYAYGAIGDWLYRKVAGLDMHADAPAYKRIRIEPLFGLDKLTYAQAAHQSMYGRVESGWRVNDGQIEIDVRIPPNTTADIVLQGATVSSLRESGLGIDQALGIHSVQESQQGMLLSIGSGSYRFTYVNADLFRVRYTEHTRIDEVMIHEAAMAVLQKYIPHFFASPVFNFMKKSSFKQLAENTMSNVSKEQVDAILEELATL